MAKKKEAKTYDYYTFSVPNEMRILFEAYISKYPNLGFRNVGQYLTHLIQGKAEDIIRENSDLRNIRQITLKSGTWVLQKDGTYKKID